MSFDLPPSKFKFEAVPGYFVYTDSSVNNDELAAIAPNFGLIKEKTWKQLIEDVQRINAKASETKVHYKLVFAARHGEGSHNVAEAKYGTEAWDAHWSLLNGDETSTWGPDPALTEVGEGQALDASKKWQELLVRSIDPVPLPTMFFASPMIRAARTLQLTYGGIAWPRESASEENEKLVAPTEQRPILLECLREDFRDRHTCDERSARSEIANRWQNLGWRIEGKMDERDTLFASEYKESPHVMAKRLADALSVVWQLANGHDVINITSHSGAMQALFRAVHHDDFKPKTGGMVPLLIKATEI